jgi:hypothetical protein
MTVGNAIKERLKEGGLRSKRSLKRNDIEIKY